MSNWLVSVIFKIVEPLLSLLEQLGLKEPLKRRLRQTWTWAVGAMTLLATSLWAAWLWLWGVTPAWAAPFLVIAVVTVLSTAVLWILWLLFRLIEQWYATHSRLSFDRSKYREFGEELVKLADEILSARNAWVEAYPPYSIWSTPGMEGLYEARQKGEENAQRVMGRFRERFLARVVRAMHNIALLGIPQPYKFLPSYVHDIDEICNYFSLVGTLLMNDQFDDARNLTRDVLGRISR